MLGFLLFISFIVHAVAFYWIFQLKRRLNEASEVENVLAIYMEEMKEQNDELIHFLKGFQTESEASGTEAPATPKEDPPDEAPKKSYEPPSAKADPVEDRFEPSFEARVFSLADQGLDHEEIAKKLGRGKGEIELLLRLEKNKKKFQEPKRSDDFFTM